MAFNCDLSVDAHLLDVGEERSKTWTPLSTATANNQQLFEPPFDMSSHLQIASSLGKQTTPISAEFNKYQNTQLQQNIAQYQLRSEISLSKQQLTDSDMEIVVKQAIIKKECTKLFLAMNKITSVGASTIASALYDNITLTELYLGHNRVSDTGVDSFAKSLTFNNNTLKGLDLGENSITDLGAEYLVEMLKTNRTLTYLWLRKNKLSDRGVELLANVLKNYNTSLGWLFLCENKLVTDSCVDSLCNMIKHTRSLKGLGMIDCSLSETGKERLQKAKQSNTDFALFV